MSTKEIKGLVRRLIEGLNKGQAAAMAVIDELYATDSVVHSGIGGDIHGIKENKQSTSEFFNAFPDLHFTIDDMVAEGDKATTRWTCTGTQKGEFMGRPPTKKKVTIWGISIDRFAGGKAVEEWVRHDTLGLMQQLGLVPTLGKGGK